MNKNLIAIAALLGLLAVGLGAFGAHGLKAMLPVEKLVTFQTGVRYHFWHVFAILAAAILQNYFNRKTLFAAAICFILGILFFSGSLYAMTLQMAQGGVPSRWLGPVTPIGGLFFMAGWALMLVATLKNPKK